ncbi:hypothetical protein ARNL5_02550 [Anaerolineae bacterium]|nr:hypothetical protein ARNL5_02550 [Anaerolineae bacterium]
MPHKALKGVLSYRGRDRLKRVGFMQVDPIYPLFIERDSLRGMSCSPTLALIESGIIVPT